MAHGHPAVVVASVSIRRGIVWGKSFVFGVQVGPYHTPETYLEQSYTLSAEAESISRFIFGRVFRQHSDYQVGRPGACEGCMEVWAKFTPYADPTDVARLMQFNLNCITRWHACRTQADIMPTVWAQVQREEQVPYGPLNCTAKAAEVAGRDAENAAIIQIVGIGKQQTENKDVRRRQCFWLNGSNVGILGLWEQRKELGSSRTTLFATDHERTPWL